MNVALVLMHHRQQLATVAKTTGKPRWRKLDGNRRRRNGLRQHTAQLRQLRYE